MPNGKCSDVVIGIRILNYYNRSNNDLQIEAKRSREAQFSWCVDLAISGYANTDDIGREKNLIDLSILGLPPFPPQ